MNYLLFFQPMIIKWANAGTCKHKCACTRSTHTCIGRGYLHKHQPFHTHRYACPGTEKDTPTHKFTPKDTASIFFIHISFNIEVYLQLPTKHKFQQGHVNNTRLTFKNTLSSQTRLIPQIYCISFTDQETLKSKIPFPM